MFLPVGHDDISCLPAGDTDVFTCVNNDDTLFIPAGHDNAPFLHLGTNNVSASCLSNANKLNKLHSLCLPRRFHLILTALCAVCMYTLPYIHFFLIQGRYLETECIVISALIGGSKL